jgi:DNA-binding GntR family transcriptional regulator
VISGSLSEVYAGLGYRPLRVTAVFEVGRADEREGDLLALPRDAPVLRAHQLTIVDHGGRAEILEVLNAIYTQDIEYPVERLPKWGGQEISNV